MKRSLVLLILILSTLANQAIASTLIISDVDDTVKVTDVLNKKNAVYNALFSKAAFSGMAQLYRELNVSGTTFFYVSGSPTYIESKVSSFLDFNLFPQLENLILKGGLKTSTYDYKISQITKLIETRKPDKVILIGDDTEFDPEVYNALHTAFPKMIDSIYIRAIQNRKLPADDLIKSFFSASEIAGLEYLKGQMSAQALNRVTKAFVARDSSKIFIKNRYCPSEGRAQLEELKQRSAETTVIDSLELAQKRIISACKEEAQRDD